MYITNYGNVDLKKGYAVAFDFDGVIHKYSKRMARWRYL